MTIKEIFTVVLSFLLLYLLRTGFVCALASHCELLSTKVVMGSNYLLYGDLQGLWWGDQHAVQWLYNAVIFRPADLQCSDMQYSGLAMQYNGITMQIVCNALVWCWLALQCSGFLYNDLKMQGLLRLVVLQDDLILQWRIGLLSNDLTTQCLKTV